MTPPSVVAIMFSTSILLAQDGALHQVERPQSASPLASIEGTIRESIGGVPIVDLMVRIEGTASIEPTRTDVNGHYMFTGLPAGEWKLMTPRERGYLTSRARANLSPGQAIKKLDIKVERAAILAGRVVDDSKSAVEGATVSVRAQSYRDGAQTVTSFHSTRTNDLGEFRIGNLLPGRYFVEVEPKAAVVLGRPRSESRGNSMEDPVIANVRTYYPNSISFGGATPLALRPGDRLENFDLTLLKAATYCVTSSIVDDTGGTNQRFTVMLSELFPNSQSRVASGIVLPGTDIQVCGIPLGSYRLWSFASSSNGPLFGSEVFAVTNRSVHVPTLYLKPAERIEGKVILMDAKPGEDLPNKMHISLEPKDRIGIAGELLDSRVDSSGAFMLLSVPLDQYWLRVEGLPPGFYVTEAAMGGHDVLREPLRVSASGELRIVLSKDGPTLSGKVTSSDNQPVVDATVVLAVRPLPTKLAPLELQTTATDDSGQFSFTGMPPGRYSVLALTGEMNNDAADPTFILANLTKATDLVLSPSEKRFVTISLSE